VSGLQLALSESTLSAFVLAVARIAGFVSVTPPFNTRSVPSQVRVGLTIALALPVTNALRTSAPALASGELLVSLPLQIATGMALGFLVLAAVSTIQAAGDLLDTVGGFSISMALDPLMLVQTSVMGRLHQITAAALLFVTDGHLVILQGLTRSLTVMPGPLTSWGEIADAATAGMAALFLGALQIAAPVVAAMLVADVALGLLTRAAPALNAFSLAYPVKILFTLLLAGLVINRLPAALSDGVEHSVLTLLNVVNDAATASGGTAAVTPSPSPVGG
jgi:flagellar biosynthetic protein FliR